MRMSLTPARPSNPIFKIFNLSCFVEPEFESGQFVINKRLHWRALHLTWCVFLEQLNNQS